MERAEVRVRKNVGKRNLRSLVLLLDDEDPPSLALVREHILKIGPPILPYFAELQTTNPSLFKKSQDLIAEISFHGVKDKFKKWIHGGGKKMDLEEGVFLIAHFEYPLFDDQVYKDWIDRVAEKIRADIPRKGAATAFKRLHSFLFGAMGFAVNEENYYDPDNSYLNRVIDTRRGTPLSLSILFLSVARRLRIPAFGIALPGHFVVGLGEPSLFWDPLLNRVLDIPGMRRRLLQNGFAYEPKMLRPASPEQILMRLLRNLMAVYEAAGLPLNVERIGELAQILLLAR